MSEADGEILFGVFTRGADGRQVIELYTAAEGAFETARKVGEYPDTGYTGLPGPGQQHRDRGGPAAGAFVRGQRA